MKFSVFGDFHYSPEFFDPDPEAKLERLRMIQRRAEKENVSFIIHAGDFCHDAPNHPELMKLYNDFHIPSYHCIGNHETDLAPLDAVLEQYKMESNQYYFDCEGYRFVVYDPCYMLFNGEYIHYNLRNYYTTQAINDFMPPENIQWMRKVIEDSPHPCVLIGHTSFESGDGIQNNEDVLQMIREVNAKRKHSVLMAINGHFHRDHIEIFEDVCHFDINSPSFQYIGTTHNHFPKELCKKVKSFEHLIIYNDPVHAVITLEGTTITIEGMESSFFMGIGPEQSGDPYQIAAKRPCTPRVQSAKITL